jgi:ubiquinone biosynthesis protein
MMTERSDAPTPGLADAARAAVDLIGNVLGNIDRLVDDVRRDSSGIARDSQALYGAAAARASVVRDTVFATPRMARVVSDGMRIIAAYRLHRARHRRAPADLTARRLDELHRRSARRIFELCVAMRGGVLKLGQFLSCRGDLLPPQFIAELSALQDRVPPVPVAGIIERIETELARPVAEVFAELDPAPIAAASLAQVHRAVLPGGRPVAVKVQVPGIEEVIESDLAALRVLAAAAGDLVPQTDLGTFAVELSRSVCRELDFVAEAESLRLFRAAFADDDQVIVPEVIDGCSSARVLTMELVEGERLTDWLDGCAARGAVGAAERDRLFELVVRSFCRQILGDGLFQGDPHPGNFLVVAGATGPRLALLDLGCVGRLEPARQRAYADVVAAVLSRDPARIAAVLQRMGFGTRSGDPSALVTFAEMMLEQLRQGASLSSVDPRAQLERAMAVARENPVVTVPEDFVLLARVFGALGGLLLHYRPAIDLFTIVAPYLARAMARPSSGE